MEPDPNTITYEQFCEMQGFDPASERAMEAFLGNARSSFNRGQPVGWTDEGAPFFGGSPDLCSPNPLTKIVRRLTR